MSEPTGGWYRLWWELVGIDRRSLAAFRVAIALILLCDLYFRAANLTAFYTDAGVFTCTQAREAASGSWSWSLHLLSGGWWWQAVLFTLAMLAAIGLLVGYYARLCAAISWALLVSLHTRNPQILQGGDVLLRCLLFWGMLLPLGMSWSMDRARIPESHPPLPRRVATVPAAALLLQVCLVYWFTAALKRGGDWRIDHTAVFYALSIDQLATPIGHWLLHYRGLLKALTQGTLVQEACGPLLTIVPALVCALISWRACALAAQWGRLLAVITFVGFHLGLAASMELGPFPYICWAAWLPFLPSLFWDGLEQRWRRHVPDGLRIWYDGECGFCLLMLSLVRTFGMLPPHRCAPAQEEPAINQLMHAENSWVVETGDGIRHLRFDALLTVLSYSPLLRPLAWCGRLPGVLALGTGAYRWIASHRGAASRVLRFLKPHGYQVEFRHRRQLVLDLGATVLIYYVVLWNWRTLHVGADFDRFANRWFPTGQNWILELPHLDQYWSMFSPIPLRDDGWYVAPATLQDGTRVDLLTGKSPTDAMPEHISRRYRDERWRKYLMNLYTADFQAYRVCYASYLARSWNHAHPQPGMQVAHLQVSFWRKVNRYDGAPVVDLVPLAHYP